jgi:AraC-like DNA-binding protein
VLAEHFKNFLDQPPMRYLVHWRLQLAARQLQAAGASVKTIALQAGYDSEAAFSRAFKREFGLAPGAWRKARTATTTRQKPNTV